MSLFRRIFKVGQSEAHSVVDKMEDPVKLTEQGIRDLKKDLDNSLQALAEVKAMAIRSRTEVSNHKRQAANYEQKAMQLIERAEAGSLSAEEADRLATEALNRKEEATQQAQQAQKNLDHFEGQISQLDTNVKKLKSQVAHYENELKTLKARARVSTATKKINKSMARVDSGGTISMLEKMKERVEQDEAMADAYGEMASESRSVDEEIDSALESTGNKGSDSLAALKARMKTKTQE